MRKLLLLLAFSIKLGAAQVSVTIPMDFTQDKQTQIIPIETTPTGTWERISKIIFPQFGPGTFYHRGKAITADQIDKKFDIERETTPHIIFIPQRAKVKIYIIGQNQTIIENVAATGTWKRIADLIFPIFGEGNFFFGGKTITPLQVDFKFNIERGTEPHITFIPKKTASAEVEITNKSDGRVINFNVELPGTWQYIADKIRPEFGQGTFIWQGQEIGPHDLDAALDFNKNEKQFISFVRRF